MSERPPRVPATGWKRWGPVIGVPLIPVVFALVVGLPEAPAPAPAAPLPATSWPPLDAPPPIPDTSVAQRVAAVLTGEGLNCTRSSLGAGCSGDVLGVGPVSVTNVGTRITVILSSPAVPATAVSPAHSGRGPYRIETGPLTGYYLTEIPTNTGHQLVLRNGEAHRALDQ